MSQAKKWMMISVAMLGWAALSYVARAGESGSLYEAPRSDSQEKNSAPTGLEYTPPRKTGTTPDAGAQTGPNVDEERKKHAPPYVKNKVYPGIESVKHMCGNLADVPPGQPFVALERDLNGVVAQKHCWKESIMLSGTKLCSGYRWTTRYVYCRNSVTRAITKWTLVTDREDNFGQGCHHPKCEFDGILGFGDVIVPADGT